MTTVQILSGENWNVVMYNARRATGWLSVFYFVSLIIMGMMIVMNLFLAILLSNFTNKEDVDAEAGVAGNNNNNPDGNAGPPAENAASPRVSPYNPISPPPSPSPGSPARPFGASRTVKNLEGGNDGGKSNTNSCVGGKVVPTVTSNNGSEAGDDKAGGKDGQGIAACFKAKGKELTGRVVQAVSSAIRGLRVPDDLVPDRALFVLGPDNQVRRVCAAIVANPGFDRFILLLIFVSSLALALDNPLRNPDSTTAVYLGRVERVMTGLFFVEMALKICAHGFLFMQRAYLRSAWNILDFVVVVISMIQLFTNDSGNLESLRSLRTLRALRPLRFVCSHFDGV